MSWDFQEVWDKFFRDRNRQESGAFSIIQSISKYSVTEIIRMIKSITAKKIFEKHLEVSK